MKTIYALVVLMLIMACKGNTEAEPKTPPHQTETKKSTATQEDLNSTSTSSQVIFSVANYDAIYASYLKLKAALVNTDATTAQAEAIMLSKAVDKVQEVGDDTRIAIKAIIVETEAAEQREAFETVSRDLEALLSDEIVSGTIYKQYCPMAFNGKGAYWLSDSKEVRNPYFGNQMLKCGVVESMIE